MSCSRPSRPGTRATLRRGCSSWWRRSSCISRGATPGDVPLQARPDPGRGLSIAAQEHPPAVPSAHCPGAGGALPRDPVRPSPSCWRITIRRRASGEEAIRTGRRRASEPSSARPTWKRCTSNQGAGRAQGAAGYPRAPPARTRPADHLGLALMSTKGHAAPKPRKPTPGRASSVSR